MPETPEARIAALAAQHGRAVVPPLMADDGGPHEDLLAFCRETGASLDYIFEGRGTAADAPCLSERRRELLRKAYNVIDLARVGQAASDAMTENGTTDVTPTSLLVQFEMIERVAGEVSDEIEALHRQSE